MSQSLEQSEINEHTWSIALTLKKKNLKYANQTILNQIIIP